MFNMEDPNDNKTSGLAEKGAIQESESGQAMESTQRPGFVQDIGVMGTTQESGLVQGMEAIGITQEPGFDQAMDAMESAQEPGSDQVMVAMESAQEPGSDQAMDAMELIQEYVPTGFITEADRYVFGKGAHYEIYNKLGSHPTVMDGVEGVYFAVWAPAAKTVSVVGDFNGWIGFNHDMHLLGTSGIYELFIPGLKEGELYKYVIVTQQGEVLFKADPYAVEAEFRPGTASVIRSINGYGWSDGEWLDKRKQDAGKEKPMAVYEVHIGSWKRREMVEPDNSVRPPRPEENGFYNYRDIVHELAAYVKEMGYTHVELMGIAEYPYDGSWGYQVTGYYAPTSRYGQPKDFMYFVDYMHRQGIGVILDWVPAHFPRDAHGLANFDGSCAYEYADSRKGEHPDWGTKVFDYTKCEVSNFLIANAMYWVEQYHVDGLRVDAVASMLYLDYGRSHGNWVPNIYGGHENLEAIEFFKHLNSIMNYRNPGAMVIAEESTAWPRVTHDPKEEGLGFTYKWNMGWMHDFLEYVKQDPLYRKYRHSQMTFSMEYAFSEKYILVLSHDEVVHLKSSMLEKMPGLPEDKMRTLKTAYTYMFGHPGKKLLFMGQEFAQIREWSEERPLDWYLLENPAHQDIQDYMKKLLHLYTHHPALSDFDQSWDGFEWVNCEDGERSTFSYIRKDKTKKKCLLFVFNFTPVKREDYQVGVPAAGAYPVILDSLGLTNGQTVTAVKEPCDRQEYSLKFDLEPLGSVVFEFAMPDKPKDKKAGRKAADEKYAEEDNDDGILAEADTKAEMNEADALEEIDSDAPIRDEIHADKHAGVEIHAGEVKYGMEQSNMTEQSTAKEKAGDVDTKESVSEVESKVENFTKRDTQNEMLIETQQKPLQKVSESNNISGESPAQSKRQGKHKHGKRKWK